MKLHTVTISGADDKADITEIASISREFPFVEWGLLLLSKSSSRSRYATRKWIDSLQTLDEPNARFSGHVCGAWAKNICRGQFPQEIDRLFFKRIQLNIAWFFQKEIKSVEEMFNSLPKGREYIIQVGTEFHEGIQFVQEL